MDTLDFLFAVAMAAVWIIGVANAFIGIRRKKLQLFIVTFSGKGAVLMGIIALIFLLVFLPYIFLGPIVWFFMSIFSKS